VFVADPMRTRRSGPDAKSVKGRKGVKISAIFLKKLISTIPKKPETENPKRHQGRGVAALEPGDGMMWKPDVPSRGKKG
jgi:hypothetical protein